MKKLFLMHIFLCFLFALPKNLFCQNSSDCTNSQTIPFTFKLNQSSITSAGVFLKDGTLIRTLWSNKHYDAGIYTLSWDGENDEGKAVVNSAYFVRVLSNNITYTWEGVIGNTSNSMSGDGVFSSYERVYGLAVSGSNAYSCANFSEGRGAQWKFSLADPNTKIPLPGIGAYSYGQITTFVCADASTVYWAGCDSYDQKQWFIFGTNTSNDIQKTFIKGAIYKPAWQAENQVYSSVIDKINDSNGLITGMSVQKKGNYLFISHGKLNQIKVLDKTTGELVQIIGMKDPNQLCTDDSGYLWVHHNEIAEKYLINSDGTILSTNLKITGLQILSIANNSSNVVFVDGYTQQVKAYNSITGVLAWILGTGESYTNPNVANNKFYFKNTAYADSNLKSTTALAFQSDGSFWVGDSYNCRLQKFNKSLQYLTTIQYMESSRSIVVDSNDPTRIFCNYLEFSIDYSKSLSPINGSWKFIRNWGYNINKNIDGQFFRLTNATTFSNGRTYCIQPESLNPWNWDVLELDPINGLRNTGKIFGNVNPIINADGSVRRQDGRQIGIVNNWYKSPLTGFDVNNNPIWGIETITQTSPLVASDDPVYTSVIGWNKPPIGEITSNGVTISFESYGLAPWGSTKYALGGIKNNKWLWRTCKHTNSTYTGDYPTDGRFDIGNSVEYTGGPILIKERNIFWGYHGELWKGAQTNYWQHFYDDGLMLGEFGTDRWKVWLQNAPPKMAGNVLSAAIVKVGTDYYLYHCDESDHGGVHRWKISGLNTIYEEVIPLLSDSLNKTSYYRSKVSGAWTNLNTWESSPDSINWFDATKIPSALSNTIVIQNGHNVTVNDSLTVDQLTIENGGALNVAPNAQLVVNDGPGDDLSIVPLGSMIIKSDSTGSGRIGISSGSVSGNVTVEQYINSFKNQSYRLISPSVNTDISNKPFIRDNWQEGQNNTTLLNSNLIANYGTRITGSTTGNNGFDKTQTGTPSLFTYDQTSAIQGWLGATNTNATTLEAKKGYLLYIPGDRSIDLNNTGSSSNTTLRSTGSVAFGTQLFTNQEGNGRFSLVTNPYPCPISWRNLYQDSSAYNAQNFESSYTYLDSKIGTNGGFVTVNSKGITSSEAYALNEIPSGRAFFIKAKQGVVSPTFTIKETHKSSAIKADTSSINLPAQLMASLYFTNADSARILADAVNAVFDNAYSPNIDGNDAEEIPNWNENIAISRGGKMLSIESRPMINTTDTLQLNTQRLKTRKYEWQFRPIAYKISNYLAFLEDKFVKITLPIDLMNVTIIPFSVSNNILSSAQNRFRVIFITTSPTAVSSIKAFIKQQGIQVEWSIGYEKNITQYMVEKSNDAHYFKKAWKVVPKLNGSLSNNYSWFDDNPSVGNNYYRIRTYYFAGLLKKYSDTVSVLFTGKAAYFSVYPNPITGNSLTLQFYNIPKGTYIVELSRLVGSGQVIFKKIVNYPGNLASITIPVNPNLIPGVYNLKITGNGLNLNKQVIR